MIWGDDEDMAEVKPAEIYQCLFTPAPPLGRPQPSPPTSVRHADHHILHAHVRCPVNELLHAGDQCLASLQAKALGVAVLFGQVQLKHLAPREAVQNLQLVLLVVLGLWGEDGTALGMATKECEKES